MSVVFRVYVGPVLKCTPKGRCEPYSVTNGKLTKVVADADGSLDYDCVVPVGEAGEEDSAGVGRQVWFDRYEHTRPVLLDHGTLRERSCFVTYMHEAIQKLRAQYGRVDYEWGIVPVME